MKFKCNSMYKICIKVSIVIQPSLCTTLVLKSFNPNHFLYTNAYPLLFTLSYIHLKIAKTAPVTYSKMCHTGPKNIKQSNKQQFQLIIFVLKS